MWMESDAIYIDGMLRLFRGEGNYNDDVNGQGLTTGSQGNLAGASFPSQTLPTTGAQARQMMYFDGYGKVFGSASGLPSGAAARTIIGWFNRDEPFSPGNNGPFGYGGYENSACNLAYYALLTSNPTLNLDQMCQTEGVNPVVSDVSGNTWYHVAFSWDGTYNRAYVNGALTGTGTPNAVPNTSLDR